MDASRSLPQLVGQGFALAIVACTLVPTVSWRSDPWLSDNESCLKTYGMSWRSAVLQHAHSSS
jgi:hypothetical protein